MMETNTFPYPIEFQLKWLIIIDIINIINTANGGLVATTKTHQSHLLGELVVFLILIVNLEIR